MNRPLIRYHGGKFRLAPWLLRMFQPHRTYTEAYGGAASVLLQKPRSYAEVYNDLDGRMVNLFRVLRDPASAEQLARACALTPYARAEFEQAGDECADDPIEQARRTIVRAQMGFGSAGATKKSTGFRIDTQRAFTTAMRDWANYPPVVLQVAERLRGVLIEHRPALEVLRQHDTPQTLHFVDPPYVHATRVRPNSGGYRHEMNDAQHQELLDVLQGLQGMVVLNGYDSPMYREALPCWALFSTQARAAGSRGAVLRTECAWLNPAAVSAGLNDGGLFATHVAQEAA